MPHRHQLARAAFALAILTASAAWAQPGQNMPLDCRGDSCTFTLAFDDGLGNPRPAITGAPYSGQVSREVARTLPNGAHTSVTQLDPLTSRDAQGRVRTEQPVFPNRPDSFTAIRIQDPVAGFQYVLDPVNHVAHRMPFRPDYTQARNPAPAPAPAPQAQTTTESGVTRTLTPLGEKNIAGIAAVGSRIVESGTIPNGRSLNRTQEDWRDPRTGESLLTKLTSDNMDMTATLLRYAPGDPDPALFRIPAGYTVVDETGPFQVVHKRPDPSANGVVSMRPAGFTSNWDGSVCTVTFNPATGVAAGSMRADRATTGAPYSGRQTLERAAVTMPNGVSRPAINSSLAATARDGAGRFRTDPAPQISGPGPSRPCPGRLGIVEILDPVAGFRYELVPADRTAYRIPYKAETVRYQTPEFGANAGPVTTPNGVTVLDEYLARKTVLGVTAVGHRTTRTNPPGTYMGNDKPVVQISETWTDPLTGIQILSTDSGPNGDTKRSYPDYKSAEPDPALFKIPDGYKVIDEAGSFSFPIAIERN